LNPDSTVKVERKLLKKKGFDFEYFTSVMNSKTGKDYFSSTIKAMLNLMMMFYAYEERFLKQNPSL
jgi:hypothetical protein